MINDNEYSIYNSNKYNENMERKAAERSELAWSIAGCTGLGIVAVGFTTVVVGAARGMVGNHVLTFGKICAKHDKNEKAARFFKIAKGAFWMCPKLRAVAASQLESVTK